MKKVFVAAAIVLGTISFSACTDTKKAEGEGTDTTMTTTEPMTTEPMTTDSMSTDTTMAPTDSAAN